MNETKVIEITETCDMAYKSEEEVYYIIHAGKNIGVIFALLGLTASQEDNKLKIKYQPLIISNPNDMAIDGVYEEIDTIAQATITEYFKVINTTNQ